MKLLALYTIAVLWGVANPVAAAPCVAATFDRPLPGAVDVETRILDVQSARFPGLWQEGFVAGHFYQIYANGDASLQSERTLPSWQITLKCDPAAQACNMTSTGGPSEAATRIAETLGQCFWRNDLGLSDFIVRVELVSAPIVEPEPPAPAPAICAVIAADENPDVLAVQQLLTDIGAEPGPLDGIIGPLTRQALLATLGEEAESMVMADVVTVLFEMHCTSG